MKDILNTGICPARKYQETNDEHKGIEGRHHDVVSVFVPLAFLDQLEPEKGGEVKREAGDEKRGDQTEQSVEEWNCLW